MKKIIFASLLAAASAAFGATLSPVQLLNPAGSTVGQTIVSTGSSSAPGWGTVPLTGLSSVSANTVLANVTGSSAAPTAFSMPSCSAANSALQYTSGTGFGCGATFALTTGTTFTGTTAVGYSNPSLLINDTSGSNSSTVYWENNGSIRWGIYNSSSTSAFAVGRYNSSSTFVDNPISIASSTGLVTIPDGVSTSTLTASGTVSGSGFSTYLASPPAIGGTTAAAGGFTTLSASGNDALLYQTTNALSIPNATNTTVTTWTKVSDRVNANFNATTGVFTAPATGYYRKHPAKSEVGLIRG